MKYSEDVKNQALALYEEGLSQKEIGRKLGIPQQTISKWMQKSDVKGRTKGPATKIKNIEFFDEIDSEYKAYFLGWLMADGNVSIKKGQHCIKVHISLTDREMIDGFMKWIESDNATSIKNKGKNPSYYVSLTSVHMVKSLMKLGVAPNKTENESLPPIAKELVPHFIRGYFDGDGITCIKERKTKSEEFAHLSGSGLRSGFIGGLNIITSIIQETKAHPFRFSRATKNKEVYQIVGGQNFSRMLYDYMYQDATIWLERKRQRMDIICNNTEVTNRFNRLLEP